MQDTSMFTKIFLALHGHQTGQNVIRNDNPTGRPSVDDLIRHLGLKDRVDRAMVVLLLSALEKAGYVKLHRGLSLSDPLHVEIWLERLPEGLNN